MRKPPSTRIHYERAHKAKTKEIPKLYANSCVFSRDLILILLQTKIMSEKTLRKFTNVCNKSLRQIRIIKLNFRLNFS